MLILTQHIINTFYEIDELVFTHATKGVLLSEEKKKEQFLIFCLHSVNKWVHK